MDDLGITLVDLDICGKDLDVEEEKAIAEATKKYLEDTSRSRGGKLAAGGFERNPRSERLQYIVQYANRKSAERVLKHRHQSFQLNQRQIILAVQMCPLDLLDIVNEKKSSDADFVDGADNDSSNEKANSFDDTFEITGENSSGSSDIEVIIHDETNGFTLVDVTESKKKDTEMFLCSLAEIIPVYCVEHVNQFARSIVVKDVPNDLYHPLLLLLENNQRGGGELVYCDRNSITNQVLATFMDIEVAETFLKMKDLKVLDHIVTICEPLIFEEQQCEANRILRDSSVKALSDYDDEFPDVFPKGSDRLSLGELERKDIEENTKSKDKGRDEEDQEKDSKIKEDFIACGKAKKGDFYFKSIAGEAEELQNEVMMTNHQGSATNDDDESNPVADNLEISHSLIVSGVTADDVDAVELYLESPKKGGGEITRRTFYKSKEEFEVTFDKEEVSGNFVKMGFFKLLGKTFYVHTSEKTDLQNKRNLEPECYEESSELIEIHNVMSQEAAELIVGLLENPRRGGGPIEQESFCEDSKILFLKFKDKATAGYFLHKEVIQIHDKVYHICPSVSSMANSCLNKASMKADRHSTDLKLKEEIESIKEHHEAVNVSHSVSPENETANFSRFNQDGVEFVQELSSKQSSWCNNELQKMIPETIASKVIEDKVSGEGTDSEEAAIDVSQIPLCMAENTLYMIFESKRYGGGEIKCLKFEQPQQKATITFKDPAVAKSMIAKEFLTFKDTRMLVTRPTEAVYKFSDNQQPSNKENNGEKEECSIEVSNIPSDMNEETLQLIFESKRFGGDDLENLTICKENRTAVLTFKDPAVASSLLNKATLKVKGIQMFISKCKEKRQHHSIDCASQLLRHESPAAGDFDTLRIFGIPLSVSEDMILMYFENNNRSGGGNLTLLSYQKRKGKAVIKFDRASDAQNVCKRKHIICGATLEISALELPLNDVKSCAIEVKGCGKNVTKNLLELYFENKNRSGGGQVEEVFLDTQQNSAVIVFQSAEDILGVMQKQHHILDNVTLDVRVLEPASPPPLLMEEADKIKFLAKRLPSSTTMESLRSYLNRATIAEMIGWVKGYKPSSALLDFSSEPDYISLRRLVSSKPFQGKMISIHRVPCTFSILVTEIPATVPDILIAMHFENEISRCTSDEDCECKVDMIPETGCAIVKFKTHKVIQSIISQPHYIEKKLVKVQPYYPVFGLKSDSLKFDSHESVTYANSNLRLMQSLSLTCDVKALHYIIEHPQLKKEIEDSLKNSNCTVQWPAAGKQEVKLHFMGKDLSSRWKVENEKILMAYVNQLTWKKQNVLREIWTDLYEEISVKKKAFPLEIAFDSDAFEIQYLGLDRHTAEFEKLLSDVKTSLENEISRKRKTVSEAIKSFKKFQVTLLESSVVQEQLKMDFCDLQFDIKESEIHLCGIPDDVKKAKLYLFEKISSVLEKSFEVSLLKAKVFVKDTVSLCLKEELIKCGISAAWLCVDNNVKVYAFDQNSLTHAIDVIRSEISERIIELKNETLPLFDSLSWKEFTAGLCNDHISLEIAFENSTVVVVCTKNSIEEVMRRLNKYVDEHAVTSQFLQMDCGFIDLISRCMSQQFQQIEKKLKEFEGRVDKILDDDNPGFAIYGNKTGVDEAVSDLLKLTGDIVAYDHVIDRPGVPAYFYNKQGKEVLNGIQLNYKVSIQVDSSTHQPQTLPIFNRCRIEVKPGKFITLQSGDITKCNADAIVNAANEELKHIGGVAAAIAKAAGPDLEEDSCARVKLHGKLLPGQACVTRAGKLPCKQVIHAVGPRWMGGNAQEDKFLLETVLSALKIGEENGLRSIAMPLISTGIFGYPLDKAADIIVESVRQFFLDNQSTTVREVFFIDNDRHAVGSIERKLRSIADQHPPEHSNFSQRTRVCKDSEKPNKSVEATFMQQMDSINTGPHGPFLTDRGIVNTTEGMKITMVKGSIVDLKADILVNTTGKELNLSHGNVSKSLLAVAGPALQSECDKKKAKNFDYGDIVVTSGHGLQCRYVYHGSCRGWDNGAGNCEQIVRVFMKNLLDRGELDKQKSAAIPAIGTGNLRIPHKIVADIMYEEVLKFSNNRKPKFLLDIQFVVYDKDINSIKAFEEKILSLNQAQSSNVSENFVHLQSLSLSPYLPGKGMLKTDDRLLLGTAPVELMKHSYNQDHHVETLPINLSIVILSIYALSQKTIENVLIEIEDIIKEYIIDKVLESPHDQENINKLNQEQIQRIQSMGSRFSVQIEIEHRHLKRIRIRGAPMDVSSVVDQIHLIFQEANKRELKKKEEEWIATMAQWEYDDGNDFEKYPDDINAIVERAYRDGRDSAEWEEENAKYRLNFKKMVEDFITKPGTSPVKVRRITKEIDIPSNWETMKDDEIYKSVLLNSNDEEYKDVEKAVMATSQNCLNTIVKIERIQNKMLYKQYLARKMAMNTANATSSQNEKTLWHGTSLDTLDSINHTGFNRSYCGKNGEPNFIL